MGELVPLTFDSSLKGKRILLRASLNSPVENGTVMNAYRVHRSRATIQALAEYGARVVVCAHIGQSSTDSLRPVYELIKKELPHPISFSPSVVGREAEEYADALSDGEVLMLENTRREAGEMANDAEFAKRLARLADFYVNDAFSDSHRTHASIVGVPALLPHAAGPNFMKEMQGVLPARTPLHPSLAIIGGAKFLTKEPLLRFLLDMYDHVFVGGALAHDFFVAKGISVGTSLVSGSTVPKEILESKKLILPEDVVVQNPGGVEEKLVTEVGPNDKIYDIGPKSLIRLGPLAHEAKFILWNGPMGNFEHGFTRGTDRIVELIALSNSTSVVGGGDTIAAIERLKVANSFTHLSTAGGAMLQFITDGTLPGVEALRLKI